MTQPQQPNDRHADLFGGTDLLEAEFTPVRPAPRGELVDSHNSPMRVIVLPPDPTQLTEKAKKLVTQNKIRQAFHHLALNNLDAVQSWLHKVAEDSPAKAVELFLELAKFSLPQLKEATLTVNKGDHQRTYQSSEEILQERSRGNE